jgi:hypothetical protein
MADFIYYARLFILSLDASDGGDLVRANGQPKRLQFGAFDLNDRVKGRENRTVAVVLWGQTYDRQERELRITECLKKKLLLLADRGANGGILVVSGIGWKITCHEGVESSDGVSSTMSSLV